MHSSAICARARHRHHRGLRRLRGDLRLSVATAATFSKVAYPEMRRFGYPQSFATGVIGPGHARHHDPPSTVFAIYGLITEQDVGKLFIAGIVPGLLAVSMYMITITLIGYARPGFLPEGQRAPWSEKFAALKDIWATLLLFAFVIGGLYGACSPRPKRPVPARAAPSSSPCARQAVGEKTSCISLLETTRTTRRCSPS